jgi:hypothetical protein
MIRALSGGQLIRVQEAFHSYLTIILLISAYNFGNSQK